MPTAAIIMGVGGNMKWWYHCDSGTTNTRINMMCSAMSMPIFCQFKGREMTLSNQRPARVRVIKVAVWSCSMTSGAPGSSEAYGKTPLKSPAQTRAYQLMPHSAATSLMPAGRANFTARDRTTATQRRGSGIRERINEANQMNKKSAVDIWRGSAGYCHANSENSKTNRNAYAVLARNRGAKRSILAMTLRPSARTLGRRENLESSRTKRET